MDRYTVSQIEEVVVRSIDREGYAWTFRADEIDEKGITASLSASVGGRAIGSAELRLHETASRITFVQDARTIAIQRQEGSRGSSVVRVATDEEAFELAFTPDGKPDQKSAAELEGKAFPSGFEAITGAVAAVRPALLVPSRSDSPIQSFPEGTYIVLARAANKTKAECKSDFDRTMRGIAADALKDAAVATGLAVAGGILGAIAGAVYIGGAIEDAEAAEEQAAEDYKECVNKAPA